MRRGQTGPALFQNEYCFGVRHPTVERWPWSLATASPAVRSEHGPEFGSLPKTMTESAKWFSEDGSLLTREPVASRFAFGMWRPGDRFTGNFRRQCWESSVLLRRQTHRVRYGMAIVCGILPKGRKSGNSKTIRRNASSMRFLRPTAVPWLSGDMRTHRSDCSMRTASRNSQAKKEGQTKSTSPWDGRLIFSRVFSQRENPCCF